MKELVWTCDYCSKKVPSIEIPKNFYQITCTIKTMYKSHLFEITMCSDCYDQTIDPSEKGLWRRFLKKISSQL